MHTDFPPNALPTQKETKRVKKNAQREKENSVFQADVSTETDNASAKC